MIRTSIAPAALVFGFLTACSAHAQETSIPLAHVPAPILDAAKTHFAGAKIVEAAKETEDGKTVYELEMKSNTAKMDVTFEPDGTLVLLETVIPADKVPAVVTKGLRAKFPKATINLVESVKKGPKTEGEPDYYEFHLTTVNRKSVEVEIDAQGKILKTEVKTEEEEKPTA
jgi:uncharacterized membrane protein YkoI